MAPSTRAKTIFSPVVSLAVFHEFLSKDGLIAKTHLAVDMLQYILRPLCGAASPPNKRRSRGGACASSLRAVVD